MMTPKIDQLLTELKSTQEHHARIVIIEKLKERNVSNKVIAKESGIRDYQLRHYERVSRELDPPVMALLENGSITYSLAKAIASLPKPEQEKATRSAIAKKISVHKFRESRNINSDRRLNVDLERLADSYSEISGFDIKIKADVANSKAGVWIVSYHDLDMFDAIVGKLVGRNKDD